MEQSQQPHLETAGHLMVRQVFTGRQDERASAAVERLRGSSLDFIDALYVVDERNHLRGVVPLPALLAVSGAETLGHLMAPIPAAVQPGMDQEHVAMLAVDHHLAHVPVVSEHGNLLGVIPPGVLIQVLWQEHAEDLHRFAGMRAGDARSLRAMDAPPLRRVADRLPWLIVGLAGSAVATFVVSRFEGMLAAKVAVGFFVPGIVYLADAIGTQTEAIAVRGLPANRVSLWTLLRGELVTGFLVGTVLGALALIFAFIAYGDFGLALSVGLALVFAGTIASTVGLFLPWLISRLGHDPAFGSGPLATVIQDVLSLIIYLVIVQMVLS